MKRWEEVYDFWIGQGKANSSMWFKKDDTLDKKIRDQFGPWLQDFNPLDYEAWKATPKGLVSLVILLDQFPRNAFRGKPNSFEFDQDALDVAREGLERGFQDQMDVYENMFLILPFEHSEDITDQKESVRLAQDVIERAPAADKKFAQMILDYAVRHHDIIEKFGRFPHRNAILGRVSSAEELAFLKTPGSSF